MRVSGRAPAGKLDVSTEVKALTGTQGASPESPAARAIVLLFSVTLFVSAALLFSVQPMVGKMLLPLLGGTPAVWNTCMLFFQATLLVGYAYAHGSCQWLGVRRQAAAHVALLLLPLLVLPVAVGAGQAPPADRTPIPWLLAQLTVGVGVPFVIVSTTAPLLQRWFAGSGHAQAKDPYFLYVASNAGSLLTLLAYPLLLEPTLRVNQQSQAWTCVYGLFVVLVTGCAIVVWRSRAMRATAEIAVPDAGQADTANDYPTLSRRLWWVFLAFVPSSLMLGVTTYITTDIAAVPLLWVLPLGLYLLSFVIVFARRPVLPPRVMGRILPFVVLPLTYLMMLSAAERRWVYVVLHLGVFFVAAVSCHGRLAASRPAARHLTEYYFWMAVGGVLGGVFNTLLAPAVFPIVFEYPLALALACCAVPGELPSRRDRPAAWHDFLLPLAGAVVWGAWIAAERHAPSAGMTWLVAVPTLACLLVYKRPVRLAGSVVVLVTGQAYLATFVPEPPLGMERDFFGVKRVARLADGSMHVLVHGGTMHGMQFTDPARSRQPLAYYHRNGPAGDVFLAFERLRPRGRVAVIGLGAGSMACYAKRGQHFTFYELDPAVARIAQDPRYFTFLQQCEAPYDIALGDGRLKLERSPDGYYDLILLDAFNSDAIPTHLLTREALALYLRKLAPGGWVAFHYTNSALEIRPVLANLAAQAGLTCIRREAHGGAVGMVPAKYAVMARSREDLAELAAAFEWGVLLPEPAIPVWTDQYSSLVELVKWPWSGRS